MAARDGEEPQSETVNDKQWTVDREQWTVDGETVDGRRFDNHAVAGGTAVPAASYRDGNFFGGGIVL